LIFLVFMPPHTSTALEGNTLTRGETKFVIEEGLTVLGKPFKPTVGNLLEPAVSGRQMRQ
jgi:hypothetical protein